VSFPMPWADFFSLVGQFLIGSLAVSVALDMFGTVIVNKMMGAKSANNRMEG
jgi:hypothetical protein